MNRKTETNESPSNGVAPQAPDSERGVSVSIFHFTVFRRRFFLFPFRLANYNESFLQHHHHFGWVFYSLSALRKSATVLARVVNPFGDNEVYVRRWGNILIFIR